MLLRSLLFVPAYSKKFIDSSLNLNADAIILDLEDSVPMENKEEARQNIKEYIREGKLKNKKIFVRLNPIESKLLFKDLECLLSEDIDGFMLSKIYTASDLDYYDKLVDQLEHENDITEGHFKFLPLIETTAAVLDVFNIARTTKRNLAICFGGEDFLQDLEGLHGTPPRTFDYPRAQIALAARSVGILPIDTPYLDFRDEEGFTAEEQISFEMGFAGALLIHPSQIKLANKCFMPSEEEIQKSRDIVAAIKEAEKTGSGVALLNGKMIGPPMRKRAEKVLDMVRQAELNEVNNVSS